MKHGRIGLIYVWVLAAMGCADLGQSADESTVEPASRSKGRPSHNGIPTINGLNVHNGLSTINGLSSTNGLTKMGGLLYLNGLATRSGLAGKNGVRVDCSGRQVGRRAGQCSGQPDGLLSNKTGLMRDEGGVEVAHYLTRCALRADQSIQVMRWDGALETLQGQIGLAPQWKTETCDVACQESVSSCLIVHTNGLGNHVKLALTARSPKIGLDRLSAFPYQEGVGYGNLFLEPPKAFYAAAPDYTKLDALEAIWRVCLGFADGPKGASGHPVCPVKYQYLVHDPRDPGSIGRCKLIGVDASGKGTAKWCQDADGYVWKQPITVWRNTPPVGGTPPGKWSSLEIQDDDG